MSAVVQRERRKTAGQRMTSLVGNAQEEDDAFWGHDTWAEEASSSGNESFRDSDQDSTHRKDEFDSDFNDSETDNEDEEEAAGQQEERDIQKQERTNRQGGKNNNNYVEHVKPGRGLFHKPKRAMGTGINAGLVLNVPPSMMLSTTTSAASGAPSMPESTTALPLAPEVLSSASVPPQAKRLVRRTNELGGTSALVTARQRRSQTKKRDSRNSTPIYSDAPSHLSNHTNHTNHNNNNNNAKRPRSSQMGVTQKSKRRRYMQEELLVEAVQETEPENQRWLLARKRVQDSAEQDKDASMAALREKHRGKNVIQKYHSRRGCLITLTFPEMDAVPELLTRKRTETPNKPERLLCVITGKPAKYRDPKTGKGFLDSAAFKELRRRHEAGVPLDQRPKSKPKPKDEDTISVNGASVSATDVKPALSPKPAGFVLDLGGDRKSPGSTRSSARKWKPSEKMLNGMGINTDDGTLSHSEKGEQLLLANDVPTLPQIKSSSNLFEQAVTSAATVTLSGDAKASASAVSKPHGEKTVEPAVVPGVASDSGTNGKPSSAEEKKRSFKGNGGAANATTTNRSRAPTLVAPSNIQVPASKPFEQVYIIPGDSDSGSAEPRYVTQSELIMQAISNYNRSTMDPTKSQTPNH